MLRLSAVCVVLVLFGVSLAELPASGGYPDRRNGNGNGNGNGGGGYQQVSNGQQTSEGQSVDPQLLDMVKMLLLQHESESANGAGGGGNGGSYPSSNGAGGGGSGGPYPSSNGGGSGGPYGSYGPPAGSSSQGGRVTGIELENPKQSMQVAEFWQGGDEQGAPSGQYGAPAQAPSGSYGAPSDSYGAPLGRK